MHRQARREGGAIFAHMRSLRALTPHTPRSIRRECFGACAIGRWLGEQVEEGAPRGAEPVDALDSESSSGDRVSFRFRPHAPLFLTGNTTLLSERRPTRRRALELAASGLGFSLLGGCSGDAGWHGVNVSGSSPPLTFSMVRASDGKEVSQTDYRGQIVMLYLGYTFCPDVCPTTLANVAEITKKNSAPPQRTSPSSLLPSIPIATPCRSWPTM